VLHSGWRSAAGRQRGLDGRVLKTLIEAAGPLADAHSVRFHAVDGYTLGDCDIATILSGDEIILAYEMNGQTLPLSQGYPLRLVVPGAGGFNWVQWVERIEITTEPSEFEFPICRSMPVSCGPSRTPRSSWALTSSAAWPSPAPGGRLQGRSQHRQRPDLERCEADQRVRAERLEVLGVRLADPASRPASDSRPDV